MTTIARLCTLLDSWLWSHQQNVTHQKYPCPHFGVIKSEIRPLVGRNRPRGLVCPAAERLQGRVADAGFQKRLDDLVMTSPLRLHHELKKWKVDKATYDPDLWPKNPPPSAFCTGN